MYLVLLIKVSHKLIYFWFYTLNPSLIFFLFFFSGLSDFDNFLAIFFLSISSFLCLKSFMFFFLALLLVLL